MTAFHEVRFPTDIALGARGGPERRTDVVVLGSGREERNQRWAKSRRRYEAGYGVTSLAHIDAVLHFFEERRGQLTGFRWCDRADDRSCGPGVDPAPTDQVIGTGDGATRVFALTKRYGSTFAPYQRPITKPVSGSVRLALDGTEVLLNWAIDTTTGVVTFAAGHAPTIGQVITAGFRFDTPVRFDTDTLEIDLAAFAAGEIPKIPLIEIFP